MYIDNYYAVAGDKAKLQTPYKYSFDNGNKCLSFTYHLDGPNVGSLNVYVAGQKVWSKVGDQGPAWHKTLFRIPVTQGSHKVLTRALRSLVKRAKSHNI